MNEQNGGGSTPSTPPHQPVLMSEVLQALAPLDGSHVLEGIHVLEGLHVIDGTFGAGGYSEALLAAGAKVTAIDRDPSVAVYAERLAAKYPGQFLFVQGRFSQLDTLIDAPVDAIVFDIGVSSMQIDEAERGFSFLRDGPLDMRMGDTGTSAAELVNQLDQKELAALLFGFGEERRSRRIAAAIVGARAENPIETTRALAELIETTVGRKPGSSHPATKSFQALRIAVNSEFDELVEGLFAAERMLPEGGKLVVVTFHSLEDRIVKRFLSQPAARNTQSRYAPKVQEMAKSWGPVAKAVKSSKAEIARNVRSRSAILRSAQRTGAPARQTSFENLGVPGFKLRGAA